MTLAFEQPKWKTKKILEFIMAFEHWNVTGLPRKAQKRRMLFRRGGSCHYQCTLATILRIIPLYTCIHVYIETIPLYLECKINISTTIIRLYLECKINMFSIFWQVSGVKSKLVWTLVFALS